MDILLIEGIVLVGAVCFLAGLYIMSKIDGRHNKRVADCGMTENKMPANKE